VSCWLFKKKSITLQGNMDVKYSRGSLVSIILVTVSRI